MEGAHLEHHQVEGAEALADGGVLAGQAGVAAEEHTMARRLDDERRPQRRVAVLQRAAGEMLRGRGVHHQLRAGQPRRLPPVELDDALRRHAPGLQVRSHAQRGDEGHALARQLADGRVVEVVVVVVRDQHQIDGRQRAQRHRHRLEALRPGQARGRGARAPHRIGEHAQAVDLDQHRRVPEPGGAQPLPAGRRQPSSGFTAGSGPCGTRRPGAEKLAQRRPRCAAVAQPRQHRVDVAEGLALPQRRSPHALQAQPGGAFTE